MDDNREKKRKNMSRQERWIAEFKELFKLALPLMAYSSLQFGILLTNQIMVGHMLGKECLAAAALGNILFDVVYYFLFGCGTAEDTLCSQAYGAGSIEVWLIWMKTAMICMSVLCLPGVVLLALGPQITLSVFRQDDDMAETVGRFVRLLIPGVLPLVWAAVLQKALQARHIVNTALGIMMACFFINIVLNLVFIHTWGFSGAPTATSVTRCVFLLLFMGYWYHEHGSLEKNKDSDDNDDDVDDDDDVDGDNEDRGSCFSMDAVASIGDDDDVIKIERDNCNLAASDDSRYCFRDITTTDINDDVRGMRADYFFAGEEEDEEGEEEQSRRKSVAWEDPEVQLSTLCDVLEAPHDEGKVKKRKLFTRHQRRAQQTQQVAEQLSHHHQLSSPGDDNDASDDEILVPKGVKTLEMVPLHHHHPSDLDIQQGHGKPMSKSPVSHNSAMEEGQEAFSTSSWKKKFQKWRGGLGSCDDDDDDDEYEIGEGNIMVVAGTGRPGAKYAPSSSIGDEILLTCSSSTSPGLPRLTIRSPGDRLVGTLDMLKPKTSVVTTASSPLIVAPPTSTSTSTTKKVELKCFTDPADMTAGGGGGGLAGHPPSLQVTMPEVKLFTSLAFSGGLMMLVEGSSYSIVTAFAGLLGEDEVAATSSLMLTIGVVYFTIPSGMATAANVHVGNFLGANLPHRAKLTSSLAISVTFLFTLIFGGLLWAYRDYAGYMFTSDPHVVRCMSKTVPYGAINCIGDGLNGVTSGILRGMGKQRRVLVYNLIGLWGVGVGLGYILTFLLDYGLEGLWAGIVAGVMTTGVLNLIEVLRADWQKESIRARLMVQALRESRYDGDYHQEQAIHSSEKHYEELSTTCDRWRGFYEGL